MFFIDSHCHLDRIKSAQEQGLEPILQRAQQAHLEHILCVNVTLSEYQAMRDFVGERHGISFSSGLHPLYVTKDEYSEATLKEWLPDPRVIAVGETGLDYYYDKSSKNEQQHCFSSQIELGRQFNKPVIVHTRDAREDTIGILRESKAEECQGVMHCFTETLEMAKQALDLGFYISFSGILTFANAGELRDVARYVPLDRILIETDSPWLAPVPYRGKENEPSYVPQVAKLLAELKQQPLEVIAKTTTANFYRLFSQAHVHDQEVTLFQQA